MDTNQGVPLAESALPIPYKDRYAGLVVFGIFTVLLGCLSALFIPLMLAGRLAAPAGVAGQPPLASIVPAMIVYGILAVALIWLGIGSIMARRWARALLLIFSWSWLVMGVLVSIFMMIFLPKILADISAGASGQPAMPPEARVVMMVTMAVIFGGIFVLMPAIWTFFYSSRHVKVTCDARDPVTRWTDACPLPVLGLSAWLAFSAPTLLITPVVGHGVMPFFGTFLSGISGGIFCLVMSCVWGYAAWALYKLKPQGWWIIFIAIIAILTSTVITFSTHDPIEMYRLMGYPEEQIAQIKKVGLLAGRSFGWLCVIWIVPLLGYLWFIRKFIFRKS